MVLSDCCSCAFAGTAKASSMTARTTIVFTSPSSIQHGNEALAAHRLGLKPVLPPPRAKKALQQLRSLDLADAAIDFRPMQAGRGGKIAHSVFDRSGFRI